MKRLQWSMENLSNIVAVGEEITPKLVAAGNLPEVIKKQSQHIEKSGIDLGTRYESDFIAKESKEPTEMSVRKYIATTYPGFRLPHLWLNDDAKKVSTLDLVETKFSLLACSVSVAASNEFISAKSGVFSHKRSKSYVLVFQRL